MNPAGKPEIDWAELYSQAHQTAQQAYPPFSGLKVGAAALVNDGRIVVGCNVENASLGLTLCAECALISALHVSGGGRLVALACVDGEGDKLTPCGRCRQLLREAGEPDLVVNETHTIDQLLPGAFTMVDLPSPPPFLSQVAPASLPGTASAPASVPADFSMQDLLAAKAEGHRLTDPQIRWFINAYTQAAIPDEQASSLLMAIRLQGMGPDELATWTAAMIDSGERLDLSGLSAPTVDKHSTGGVGDKISLILAPLVAACGAAVPQLSGRGLGHTGGTLDKLEAIAGWRAQLDNAELVAQLAEVGATICAAGEGLAPADRKLYALRDVTGTVESIPLIASSIMSKKIAEGTANLVLDVKVGTGAFMKTQPLARQLAEAMVQLGADHQVATTALLTNMDTPLGNTAGNAIEVAESVGVLAGGGPSDVRELTLALAREMLELAGLSADPEAALDSGAAMDVWRKMITTQGGDPDAELPTAAETHEVSAPESGYLTRLDAMAVGVAAWRLGAGRSRKEDQVDLAAGVVWHARPGDKIAAGDKLFTLHTGNPELFEVALGALDGGYDIGPEPPAPAPLVLDKVTAG